jgi:glycosyltransferase involved in cell wall biosynthesis
VKEHLDSTRRNLTMTRLEMGKLCTLLGHEPWRRTTNSAYSAIESVSVTVIITLFNYSEYISECLESVCNSEADNLPDGFEILVIDDGSTDGSADVVKHYMHQSNIPICLIEKVFNTGLADARNTGLHSARAPYVFILDADNWIYPNCLSKMYETLDGSDFAAAYGIINQFDNETREGCGLVSLYEWDIYELVQRPFIDAMAMFRRDVLIQLGGYSVELMEIGWCGWEDYDLWLKIAQAGYLCKCLPQILSAYRSHSHSMIATTSPYELFIARHFTKKYADLLEKCHPDSYYLFGVPKDKLLGSDAAPSVIAANGNQEEIQRLKVQLRQARQNAQNLKDDLEQALNRIAAMETSKFWKLRASWFRLKRVIGLPGEE